MVITARNVCLACMHACMSNNLFASFKVDGCIELAGSRLQAASNQIAHAAAASDQIAHVAAAAIQIAHACNSAAHSMQLQGIGHQNKDESVRESDIVRHCLVAWQ